MIEVRISLPEHTINAIKVISEMTGQEESQIYRNSVYNEHPQYVYPTQYSAKVKADRLSK